MNDIKTIGFLSFESFGEQDLLAPWELLKSLAWTMAQQSESLQVTLGAFAAGMTTTQMGARVENERQLVPTDRFDLLYVPGGIGAGAASKDQTVLDFVRAHHEEGRWVVGNCAGLGVLHRAGILDGIEVTAPATVSRRLEQQGTKVATPRLAWKTSPEQKVFTTGGAATVHASTIALVCHLFGKDKAQNLALTWDSLSLYGESLFALDGPILNDDDATKRGLQDAWEDIFLPN